jgi:hypothetical protein
VKPDAPWTEVLARAVSGATARRLSDSLLICEDSALQFCRLLDAWRRGDASPGTAAARRQTLRERASAAENALVVLDEPLGRYLLELQPGSAEGRSWYGQPGPAEVVDWEPVLDRAGLDADPNRVMQAYLELAVLVRALQGLASSAELDTEPTASDLWAGLFDLRENLWTAVDDLHALAA